MKNRKIKSVFLIVLGLSLAVLLPSCKKNKGDGWSKDAEDVHTGVMLNGKEIIVMDRNAGAKEPGQAGRYLSWWGSKDACPSGYHLMTWAEADAIMRNANYDTVEELVSGNLKLPLAGYMRESGNTIYEDGEQGYLYLAEQDTPSTAYFLYYGYVDGNNQIEDIDIGNGFGNIRNAARCVKGKAPAGSTVPSARSNSQLPADPRR